MSKKNRLKQEFTHELVHGANIDNAICKFTSRGLNNASIMTVLHKYKKRAPYNKGE